MKMKDNKRKCQLFVLPYQGNKGNYQFNSLQKRLENLLPNDMNTQTADTGRKLNSCFNSKDQTMFQCYPIRFQCTLSLTPENIRKPYGCLMFLGGRERVHWEGMG